MPKRQIKFLKLSNPFLILRFKEADSAWLFRSGFELPSAERTLSEIFDEAWARALMKQAAIVQRLDARGEHAKQRVELLRLRFQEGLPIRKIAEDWGADAANLHHEYARARDEFRQALKQVVAEHHSGPPGEVERECARLISLFS